MTNQMHHTLAMSMMASLQRNADMHKDGAGVDRPRTEAVCYTQTLLIHGGAALLCWSYLAPQLPF